MKLKSQDNDLTAGSIPKLLRELFIPASIGLFFNVLFNIVDTYFGGLISPTALASLSITFPLFFVVLSLAIGFSTGASALISTQIGSKNKEEAKKLYCQNLSLGIILSIFATLLGFVICKPLLIFLGAQGQYLQEAYEYIIIIFAGSIFLITAFMVNSGLSAIGENRPNRNFLVVSFFVNIFLDYWFVKGGFGLPALGITGIALATVLVHVGGIFYLFYYIKKSYLLDNVPLDYFIPKFNYMKMISVQGFPATFNILSIGIYFFILNKFLAVFGQDAIAAYGVGLRIEQLILVPGIGISIAVTTLVAQNHGAFLKDRVIETIKTGLLYSLIIMLLGAIMILTAGEFIFSFFTQKESVINIGLEYLNIEAFTLFSYSFIHIFSSALQGMKKPNISSVINLVSRLTPLPILMILISEWGLGSKAIWWTIFGNSWFMAILFMFFIRRTIKKSFKKVALPS